MEVEFLIGKVRKRLQNRMNHFLSQEGKIVLLRHVLKAISGYHLLLLSLNKQGYGDLERECRQFVWGEDQDDHKKKALIAWSKIMRPKFEGDLKIRPFETQLQVLKIKCVTQLLEGRKVEWTMIVMQFFQEALCTGPEKKEHKNWKTKDALLLVPQIKVIGSNTIKGMVKEWATTMQQLEYQFIGPTVPMNILIE